MSIARPPPRAADKPAKGILEIRFASAQIAALAKLAQWTGCSSMAPETPTQKGDGDRQKMDRRNAIISGGQSYVLK
jgi:hypothetical protein